MTAHRRRRKIIPEVIQISATDCGPASLKSMFAGMGVELNYRVLREVCQTDIDGTSIGTLDEVANQLGLDAEEVMLPVDHVVLPEAKAAWAAATCATIVGVESGVMSPLSSAARSDCSTAIEMHLHVLTSARLLHCTRA